MKKTTRTIDDPFIPDIRLSPRCFIQFIEKNSKGKIISFFNFGRTKVTMLSSIAAIQKAGKLEKKGNPDRQAFNADFIPVLGDGAFTAPPHQWLEHKRQIMRHLTPSKNNKYIWEKAAIKATQMALNNCDQKSIVNGFKFSQSIGQEMIITVFFGAPSVINKYKLGIINKILMFSIEGIGFVRLWFGGKPKWLMKIPQTIGHLAGYSLEKMVINAKPLPESPAADPAFRKEIHTLLFAGQDTLTCALMSCLWILGNDLSIQDKARLEIKNNNLENCYLKNIVLETLRMLPPLHTPPLRLCPEAMQIDGQTIPAGSTLVYGIWHAHRRCSYPNQFNPDRFKDPISTQIIPFGTGPKRCVGEHIALCYLTSVLAEMLSKLVIISEDKTLTLNPRTITFSNKPLLFTFKKIEE